MTRYVGQKVARVEDRRILTGRGKYVDDVKLPDMTHAAFVRSPLPHARITNLDVSAARTAPGVVAVYTGEDMRELSNPITSPMAGGVKFPEFYPLVTDKVRFVGDVVAMVVAESRYQAEDACELVEVDYDPLDAVAGYDVALDASKPPLFDELGDNIVSTN
jgi:carbon-monoxide dehydrogenase large subunit